MCRNGFTFWLFYSWQALLGRDFWLGFLLILEGWNLMTLGLLIFWLHEGFGSLRGITIWRNSSSASNKVVFGPFGATKRAFISMLVRGNFVIKWQNMGNCFGIFRTNNDAEKNKKTRSNYLRTLLQVIVCAEGGFPTAMLQSNIHEDYVWTRYWFLYIQVASTPHASLAIIIIYGS